MGHIGNVFQEMYYPLAPPYCNSFCNLLEHFVPKNVLLFNIIFILGLANVHRPGGA